jgi:hypothetical protein
MQRPTRFGAQVVISRRDAQDSFNPPRIGFHVSGQVNRAAVGRRSPTAFDQSGTAAGHDQRRDDVHARHPLVASGYHQDLPFEIESAMYSGEPVVERVGRRLSAYLDGRFRNAGLHQCVEFPPLFEPIQLPHAEASTNRGY